MGGGGDDNPGLVLRALNELLPDIRDDEMDNEDVEELYRTVATEALKSPDSVRKLEYLNQMTRNNVGYVKQIQNYYKKFPKSEQQLYRDFLSIGTPQRASQTPSLWSPRRVSGPASEQRGIAGALTLNDMLGLNLELVGSLTRRLSVSPRGNNPSMGSPGFFTPEQPLQSAPGERGVDFMLRARAARSSAPRANLFKG